MLAFDRNFKRNPKKKLRNTNVCRQSALTHCHVIQLVSQVSQFVQSFQSVSQSNFCFLEVFYIFFLLCFFVYLQYFIVSLVVVPCGVRYCKCVRVCILSPSTLLVYIFCVLFFSYNFRNITFIIIFYTAAAAYLELSPFFGCFQSTNSTL